MGRQKRCPRDGTGTQTGSARSGYLGGYRGELLPAANGRRGPVSYSGRPCVATFDGLYNGQWIVQWVVVVGSWAAAEQAADPAAGNPLPSLSTSHPNIQLWSTLSFMFDHNLNLLKSYIRHYLLG